MAKSSAVVRRSSSRVETIEIDAMMPVRITATSGCAAFDSTRVRVTWSVYPRRYDGRVRVDVSALADCGADPVPERRWCSEGPRRGDRLETMPRWLTDLVEAHTPAWVAEAVR